MEPTSTDLFNEQQAPKGLPGNLNVLTILTFIGCGLAYISTIYSFFTSSAYEAQRDKLEEARDSMGNNELANSMMDGSLDMMQKSYDNRYLLLASGIIFTTMCLIGALQMRKLKRSGYLLYVIGEIAPVIVTIALLGFSLMGGIAIGFGAVIALVFVILYSTQRKHLINP